MLSVDDLERAQDAIGVRAPVRSLEVTPSTNAVALELAEGGAPEWTLVAAEHQSAGRGRLGRTWTDVAGGALMVSVVLRPEVSPERAGLLPLLAGAAAARAVGAAAGVEVRCKWPNDLLARGGKVGGILVESSVERGRIRHAVVGMGVNRSAPSEVPGAAAVGDLDERAVLEAWLLGMHEILASTPGSFASAVVEAWSSVAATLGREVEVTHVSGDRLRGTAERVDDRGALVVRTSAGERTVVSGEVEHLR